MNTIWKFPITYDVPRQGLMLPPDAQILSVKNVDDVPMMHVLLDPKAPLEFRYIQVIGTGSYIEDITILRHIDTVVFRDGVYIYHFFEERQT